MGTSLVQVYKMWVQVVEARTSLHMSTTDNQPHFLTQW